MISAANVWKLLCYGSFTGISAHVFAGMHVFSRT